MLAWVRCPQCHAQTADQHGGIEGSEDWGALYVCRHCGTAMRRPEDFWGQVGGIAIGLLVVAVGVAVLAFTEDRELNTWLAAVGLVVAGALGGLLRGRFLLLPRALPDEPEPH
jgi:hypothetical protein